MTILAIDTATQRVSLALHDGAQIIAEHSWHSPNQHTRQVPPLLSTMLAEAGLTVPQLSAVAVAAGPGSYTAVRMGIALAKGLAEGAGLPLIGVPTFDITAAGIAGGSGIGALIVTLLAGRGRVSVARFQWRKNAWKPRAEAENMTWDDLLASIDGAAALAGEIDAIGQERIAAARAAGTPLTVLPASACLRRAGLLAEIAWGRLRDADESGGRAELAAGRVAPIYIGSKENPA